jgi:membrane-associated phospholipid phosphatase
VRTRTRALWPAKMASNILGMGAFFAAYFWVLHHPQAAVTVMPLTALDRWVAFTPAALPLYMSLWVYVSLPLALLRTRRELQACGWATLALSVIGMAIFLAFPTTVPPAGIDWSQYASIAFLKTIDVGDNACPSLHVAFAVFTLGWLGRLLAELRSGLLLQAVNLLWCLGIVYSTLATRQHVALDVLAGTALGVAIAAPHEWRLRRLARQGGAAPAPRLEPRQHAA